MTQVQKEDSGYTTEQKLKTTTEQQQSGFCACLCSIFSCCSPAQQPEQNNSTQV